jgi:hypothetical protein
VVGHITVENIDEFLIAETEGIITMEDQAQLNEFIVANPVFEKDRRIYPFTHLTADSGIVFDQKDVLKHKAIPVGEINENNYEDFMIAEVEGSFSQESDDRLKEFLTLNPHLEQDHRIFELTKLQPETTIVFSNKASLKHAIIPVRRIVFYALSAAASIALLFGVYSIWYKSDRSVDLVDINTRNNIYQSVTAPLGATKTKGNSQQFAPDDLASDNSTKPMKIIAVSKSVDNSHTEPNSVSPVDRNIEPMLVVTALACHEIISHDFVEPEFMFIRTSQMHSNEYLELYYNVKLSEQIQYAQLNASDRNPEKTLFNSVASRIGEIFAFNKKNANKSKSEVSVWTFAELGVKSYNNITQDNVQLDLERDENGKVVGYSLQGDKLDLQRDVKK